ncbi:hypothetical protein BN59_01385 [Legionella massiliensis]|uniref:Tfp pilus assembly protein PilX n=1 Tax=Legionella massiliensis TaxID=1034943 RepID=A0A078KZD0_9GAMM|nr:hypothetical protein [Legionella massiliensis]CDZ77103.1 hypothetical protein BN59_01385 [Legionella massiliensis]CEE12841.1 hypothetical protein BN1094_01385 [Legionella massiliensis]
MLVTTLMMIVVSSLLVLSQMRLFLLDYKVLSLLKEKQQSLRALEAVVAKLAAQATPGECILKEQAPNLIVDLLKNKRGCIFIHEEHSYYYLIEDLGVFPCLQIQRDNLNYSTHHLQISLGALSQRSTILQIRFAKLAEFVHCENQKPGKSRLGLLSWRVL